MKIYYSDEPIFKELPEQFEHSLFLAGPTPRSSGVKGWRDEAISILNVMKYDGLVWVPELQSKEAGQSEQFDYINQVQWEKWGLETCKKIVFWIPRSFPDMPGLTTNVEMGYYLAKSPEKCCYGRPEDSPKNKYIDWLFSKDTAKPIFKTLSNLLIFAIS